MQHIANHGEYKFSLLKKALTAITFTGILHPIVQISTKSRRRVNFKVNNNKLSFNQFRSKQQISIAQCLLLEEQINSLIRPINLLLKVLHVRVDMVNITNSDTGIELVFYSKEKNTLAIDLLLAEFAMQNNIARIIWQERVIVQHQPVQLKFNDFYVDLPINSFLQVSKESADLMVNIILKNLNNAKQILELYCGCGSFTIPIATKGSVFALEGNDLSVAALEKAAKRHQLPIRALKQDLYQNPLSSTIINDYSQVIINPPRNGAAPQIKQIAGAKLVKKVILVSCSLENFIRDARILLNANFILEAIYPIDQFLYSDHLEIIGIFVRI